MIVFNLRRSQHELDTKAVSQHEPMSNDQQRPACEAAHNGLPNPLIRLKVDGGCSLITDDDLRVSHERTGQSEKLPSSQRKVEALILDSCVRLDVCNRVHLRWLAQHQPDQLAATGSTARGLNAHQMDLDCCGWCHGRESGPVELQPYVVAQPRLDSLESKCEESDSWIM